MTACALLSILLLPGLGSASAAEAPKEPKASPAPTASTTPVAASSPTAKPRIEDFYTGAKKRDPFVAAGGSGGSGGGGASSGEPKELDIDGLDVGAFIPRLLLKGLMRDKHGTMALLLDSETETGLILRGGRLYDYKHKLIKGVLGEINMAQKTVKLTSPDKEVRVLRLGEDERHGEDSGRTQKQVDQGRPERDKQAPKEPEAHGARQGSPGSRLGEGERPGEGSGHK